jgi:hypothetical protein
MEGNLMPVLETREALAIYVVVMREALIARDIEMIIRDFDPSAYVAVAATLHEVNASLPHGRIMMSFVQMGAADIAVSPLGQRVAADGGRMVLVGIDATDPLPERCSVLRFPFTGQDVETLLAGLW